MRLDGAGEVGRSQTMLGLAVGRAWFYGKPFVLELGGIITLTYFSVERLREKEVVTLFTAVHLLYNI